MFTETRNLHETDAWVSFLQATYPGLVELVVSTLPKFLHATGRNFKAHLTSTEETVSDEAKITNTREASIRILAATKLVAGVLFTLINI